jgi:antitoxin (DNA-binding transcriptional repressor) of toxin-antitoxin stability system
MMKRYTVAQVRERLSDALDQAEQGESVIIERRGVRYQLTLAPDVKAQRRKAPGRIEIVDPSVDAGDWSWNWSSRGLTFRARHKR